MTRDGLRTGTILMVATTEPGRMKQRGRPKTSERNDVSVKVDRTIVGKAKLIATYRGISVAELFSETVPMIDVRAYAKWLVS